jgi:GPH family glycoside/pentoside/hexuronide:cation symporter
MIVLIFSIMIILFYLPSIIFLQEKPGIVIPERSIVDETKTILKNDTFVKFIFIMGFASFSFSAITTEIVGYAQQVLLLTAIESIIPPAIALLISIMVFFYIWTKILKRTGKGRLYSYSYIGLAILMCLTPVIGLLVGVISNVILAAIYFIPLAACMAVHFLMSYVVPADIANVDELKSGKSRAGIYEGFKGVPLNIFQAITGLSLGWLMQFSEVMTGDSYFGYLWFGPIFAPFLIISVLILRKTNIDPDFDALEQESATSEELVDDAESAVE